PFLPAGCRFYPTCSEYSAQALERYNIFKALGLSLVRLLKCHPYHSGGSDPVK
ncbi:MAG TPA: membrane protein insertion efficiency factor YidD, partial [Nitrospinaceae bacterium]|nr:membrane protein insertion efficiency factor YidD [Nitrospinaceae bacterium]